MSTIRFLAEARRKGVGTVAEVELLTIVSQFEAPATVREIADKTTIPYTSVSRVLWGLATLGLLRHTTSQEDRRIRLISVAPAGRSLMKLVA